MKKSKSLRLQILEQMASLVTAGFGLVAALAWNDAIQSLFKLFLPETGEVWAKFIYAVLITVMVVFITLRLSGIIDRIKGNSSS